MRHVAFVVLALLSACAPPATEKVAGSRLTAVTQRGEVPGSAQGMTLLADADNWPVATQGGAVAVLVTVINGGERPIRLERDEFTLLPRGGLASREAGGPGTVQMPLVPRGELQAQALPEGTLKPGESARGFVFFADRPSGAAQVQARLVDAETGAVLDVISVGLPATPRPR